MKTNWPISYWTGKTKLRIFEKNPSVSCILCASFRLTCSFSFSLVAATQPSCRRKSKSPNPIPLFASPFSFPCYQIYNSWNKTDRRIRSLVRNQRYCWNISPKTIWQVNHYFLRMILWLKIILIYGCPVKLSSIQLSCQGPA